MPDPEVHEYIREHEDTLRIMQRMIPYLPPMSEARIRAENRLKEAKEAGYDV